MTELRNGRIGAQLRMPVVLTLVLIAAAACGKAAQSGGSTAPAADAVAGNAIVVAKPAPSDAPPAPLDAAVAPGEAPAPVGTGSDVVINVPVDDASGPPRFVWRGGDPASLPPGDARFLQLIEPLLADFHWTAFRTFVDETGELGPRDAVELRLAGRTMRRLPVAGTLDPMSTGALDVTFWKTDDGLYFVRTAGGCVVFNDLLYGPFRAQGEMFVFARDARGPTSTDGGPASCTASAGEWCPAVSGDPCGGHRDGASCAADTRCVARPYLDDSLRLCGQMGFDCVSAGCPPIGCESKCNTLESEADCTAHAPRCLWTDRGCSAREWDCIWR
jgi:hypothetical protein